MSNFHAVRGLFGTQSARLEAVRFYLVALVFIVFDALAVFLFPWALAIRQLGAWGILAMLMFLSILLLGWVYAYRERILEWK